MVSTNTRQIPPGIRWLAYAASAVITLAVTAALTLRMAPNVGEVSNETVWYAIRASGVVAYLLLAASTVWGVMLSSKIVKQWVPGAIALDLHNYLSWLAIGLAMLHAALLLFSSYFDYSPVYIATGLVVMFFTVYRVLSLRASEIS